MKRPPVCSRCDKRHFNFVRCEDAPAWREPTPQRVHYRPLPDGVREYGDHFETLQRLGENTFVLKKENR